MSLDKRICKEYICLNQIQNRDPFLVIAGDNSGTNVLMGVYESVANEKSSGYTEVFEGLYDGQQIKDFGNDVLADILEKVSGNNRININKDKIHRMVLSPAGPIEDKTTCNLTNADYSLDTMSYGVPTVLLNDFAAIGFAVAAHRSGKLVEGLETVRFRHTSNSNAKCEGEASTFPYGVNMDHENIGILGAGTGLGESRLINLSKLPNCSYPLKYAVLASEGGHKSSKDDDYSNHDSGIINHLRTYFEGNKIHQEAILSGKGVGRVFEYFLFYKLFEGKNINKTINPDFSDGYFASKDKMRFVYDNMFIMIPEGPYKTILKDCVDIEDRAAFVAKTYKSKDESKLYRLAKNTLNHVYSFYGRAARDLAVHEIAKGGIYIAGGMAMKDLPKENGFDSLDYELVNRFMDEFDSGPTHRDWVNNIGVNLILDKKVGLKGAKIVATDSSLFNVELNDYWKKYSKNMGCDFGLKGGY